MFSLKTHRAFLASLTLATFLFATTTSTLWHHHESNAPNCQICHIAHLPVLPVAACLDLPEPIVTTSTAPARVFEPYLEPIAQYSPPRAPPA